MVEGEGGLLNLGPCRGVYWKMEGLNRVRGLKEFFKAQRISFTKISPVILKLSSQNE